MSEPEPLTPEEKYAEAKFALSRENQNAADVDMETMIVALRAMIESDRMEMNLLLAALTTLDNRVSVLEAIDRREAR